MLHANTDNTQIIRWTSKILFLSSERERNVDVLTFEYHMHMYVVRCMHVCVSMFNVTFEAHIHF